MNVNKGIQWQNKNLFIGWMLSGNDHKQEFKVERLVDHWSQCEVQGGLKGNAISPGVGSRMTMAKAQLGLSVWIAAYLGAVEVLRIVFSCLLSRMGWVRTNVIECFSSRSEVHKVLHIKNFNI